MTLGPALRWPRFWRGLAISLGAFCGLGVLGELGMRIAGYKPLPDRFGERAGVVSASPNDSLRYVLNPGAQDHGLEHPITINSLGFRDREYELAKPEGVQRIVALGDSITFGLGLDFDEVWPKVLEVKLGESGRKVEVLNLGVSGYDTGQEVAFLEYRGLDLDPDIVVLAYCVNDVATVSNDLTLATVAKLIPPGLLGSRVVQWGARSLGRIESRSWWQKREQALAEGATGDPFVVEDALCQSLRKRIEQTLAAMPEKAGEKHDVLERRAHLAWYASAGRLASLRGALRRLSVLATERSFTVVFFVVPYLEEGRAKSWQAGWSAVYALVERATTDLGFALVDIRGPLAASLATHPSKDSIHPPPEGHAVIAQTLLGTIKEHLDRALEPERAVENGR